jgi:Tfp pilus assembly protein PilF
MDQAMAEAREGVSLAPKLVQSHYTLAYLQAQAGHKADARLEYQTALSLARTIHPEFQSFWIPFLERALQGL